jgi:hypothetical protein
MDRDIDEDCAGVRPIRAYLVAFSLVALVVGLPILLAGLVRIGCTVTSTGGTTMYSNCGGADALEWAGAALLVASLLLFAASFVPVHKSDYK